MRKRKNKVGRVKVVGEGLEGFVDWGEPITSEPTKEKEDDMSILGCASRLWALKARLPLDLKV